MGGWRGRESRGEEDPGWEEVGGEADEEDKGMAYGVIGCIHVYWCGNYIPDWAWPWPKGC